MRQTRRHRKDSTQRVFGRIEARGAVSVPVIDVAACIVQASDGRVLLAERTARQVAAGFWELPGGKIEPGESAASAAARELREETGLTAIDMVPWLNYEHRFPTKRVRLHLFRARAWEGKAVGCEGQRLAWVDPLGPHVGPLLSSNDRALFALGLPAAYVVEDFRAKDRPEDFLSRLREHLSQGAKLIRVRISNLSPGQSASLLGRVAALAGAFPGAHVLTASAMNARRAGLAGVHSCARDLRGLVSRPSAAIWAATCHGDADVSRAISLGADFLVLSPVLADPDRPDQTPIGWEGLRRIVASCPIGIYAQGGLTPEQTMTVQQAGAVGVVVCRSDIPRDATSGLRH
jgi:8-oxo-dGTP diphosphatase